MANPLERGELAGGLVRIKGPIETRDEAYQDIDRLLDEATVNAHFETMPGQTTTEIGDLGEGRGLVVAVCRYEKRCRVGERLLTGERTVQPVVALVENNRTGKTVKPLPYAEDIVGLPLTLPARVIGCLRGFNGEKVS